MIKKTNSIKNASYIIFFAVLISLGLSCTNYEWECDSGQCISRIDLCDGVVNCSDESDETEIACFSQICPSFAFQCAYGACVSGFAKCNNIKECADNSDEMSSVCANDTFMGDSINSNCSDEEFQCSSYECISIDKRCDGYSDCSDQSDEQDLCSINSCPEYTFRCNYGACISMEKKCDGKFDCRDISDENPRLCGSKIPIPTPSLPTGSIEPPNRVITDENRINVELPNICEKVNWKSSSHPTCFPPILDKGCEVPDIPNFLFTNDVSGEDLKPGDRVVEQFQITYKCKTGYNRVGLQYNICMNSTWLHSHSDTRCIKYCSPQLLQGIAFVASCKRDDIVVLCTSQIEPNTIAEISCPIQYRKSQYHVSSLTCGDDGNWDKKPEPCKELCGIKKLPSEPFMLGASDSNITDVPWHVAIYSRLPQAFTYICGGSIISAKIIISAAHCFWNFETRSKYDSSYFTVAAGKTSRHYQTFEEHAQFQNISEIHIPSGFDIGLNNFKADIAILKVTQFFKLSPNVAPVCIEWRDNAEKVIENNKQGKIAGWGKLASDENTDTLRSALVSALSYTTCLSSIEKKFSASVETDKFCVINTFGVTACKGDSGGGFIVEQNEGKKIIHYLWGIISTGVPKVNSCEDTEFVTYTNIQFHEMLIKSILSNVKY